MTAREEKTFKEHISELQLRLLTSILCVSIGAIGSYFYHERIIEFLTRPLGGPLYYTTPTGGFDLVFKVSLISGVFIASPILVYQVLAFLEPVIPEKSTNSLTRFLFASWILLIAGAGIAYYLSLPAALRLLNEFSSQQIKAIISTKDYFSFIISYLGGFAIVFQLPIIMLLINKIKPLKPKILIQYLRHVVLVSFILAAILTPTPDPINQTIMAAPLIILYLFSILCILFMSSSPKSKETKNEFFLLHGALLLASGQISNSHFKENKRHFRYLR